MNDRDHTSPGDIPAGTPNATPGGTPATPVPSVDAAHARPPGATDDEVAAAGRIAEALERVERARGALYDFHQLIGRADALLDDVVDLLERSGHQDLAAEVRDGLLGLNVLAGRWTFQIVEEFDAGYYGAWRDHERRVRDALVGGRTHVYEAEMKERRRTAGRPGHEPYPQAPGTT